MKRRNNKSEPYNFKIIGIILITAAITMIATTQILLNSFNKDLNDAKTPHKEMVNMLKESNKVVDDKLTDLITTGEYIVKNMGKKKVLWSDDSINLGYTGSHGFHTYIDVLSLLSVVGVTVTEIYYEVKWQRYYYSGFGTLGGEYSWKQIPYHRQLKLTEDKDNG